MAKQIRFTCDLGSSGIRSFGGFVTAIVRRYDSRRLLWKSIPPIESSLRSHAEPQFRGQCLKGERWSARAKPKFLSCTTAHVFDALPTFLAGAYSALNLRCSTRIPTGSEKPCFLERHTLVSVKDSRRLLFWNCSAGSQIVICRGTGASE